MSDDLFDRSLDDIFWAETLDESKLSRSKLSQPANLGQVAVLASAMMTSFAAYDRAILTYEEGDPELARKNMIAARRTLNSLIQYLGGLLYEPRK